MNLSNFRIKQSDNTYISLLDLWYPVGSIYIALTADQEPGKTIGGTWVEHKFDNGALLAIGGTNYANQYNYGGSSKIAVSQLPSHTHTGPSHTHTGPSHTHALNGTNAATNSTGSHNHTVYYKRTNITINNSGNTHVLCASSNVNASGPGLSQSIVANGAHSHTLSGNTNAAGTNATGASGTGNTGSTGGGGIYPLPLYCFYVEASCLASLVVM